MPVIKLTTTIRAPSERCFDLARSIDFHVVTARNNQETAVGGRTTGLIGPGETVTWRARHLGLWQNMTVEITAFDRPRHFRDAMTNGSFASMRHDHHFEERDGVTVMLDSFIYQSPMGLLGALVDQLFLRQYLRRFLVDRALLLKSTAESDAWRDYLVGSPEEAD